MSEKYGLATRIAHATDIHREKVCEVVKLALEELHRISIIDEKGTTAAVMEACFSFGDETAFHLIGLFVSEHDYHGRDDDAGIWSEVAKRFIPSAYAEGCARIAPWFREKTADRLGLDADIRNSSSSMSEKDELDNDYPVPQKRASMPPDTNSGQQPALIDPPSPFDTLQTWEQHLADPRKLPDNIALKQEMISRAEEVLARKRWARPFSPAAALAMGRAAMISGRRRGDPQLAKAGRRLIDETNLALNSPGSMSPNEKSENLTVIVGPSKIDGGVSRVMKRPDGSAKIESWKPGVGWVEGGTSLDEFMPGACTPVTPELAKRLGIPDSELDPGDPG